MKTITFQQDDNDPDWMLTKYEKKNDSEISKRRKRAVRLRRVVDGEVTILDRGWKSWAQIEVERGEYDHLLQS